MRLRVLGCSGGIGGRHLRTTSFLVDSDVLVDAGTGVGDLTLAELSQIDHIFITHSHLDHVTSIPFLVDTVGGMRLRVLGCSGGIGGRLLRTTSFLVDSDILIDAGTGVGDLTLAELSQIDTIFITHSHLDHVTSIPFLVDTVGGMRSKPLLVYATRATIEIMRNHLFNWSIWPDFSEIPSAEAPFLRYEEIAVGETVRLGTRSITALPARHTVPAVGYHLDSGAASLVFTGDTGPNDALWREVNRITNLKFLIIETAFSNKERALAEMSRHLCPATLAEELEKLELDAEVYITHLKPGEIEPTMLEIAECAGRFRPQMLQNNLVLEF